MSTTFETMPHHLVGTAEIAEMFGVSRQYADRLSRSGSFPEPEVELASGRIWSREAVAGWAREFRRHFCIPAGGPNRHAGATTISCAVCDRVWVWDGTGAWKNTIPPLTLDGGRLEGEPRRFFVQHLDMSPQAGPNGANWTRWANTLDEAIDAADSVYDPSNPDIRQEIIETIDDETSEWRFRGGSSPEWSRPYRGVGGR